MKKILFLIFVILCISMNSVFGASPTRVATYTSGAVINPSDVTSNEDAIFTYLQGGVDVIKDNTIVAADIQDSAVTTAKILDGTITTSDISATAAIEYSKLNLTGGIVTADLTGAIALTTTETTTTSGLSVTGFFKDKDGDIGVSNQVLTTVNGQVDWQSLTQSSQAIGVTSGPTTTSTSYVDLTDMSITITTGANPVLILFSSPVTLSTSNGVNFILDIDGTDETNSATQTCAGAGTVQRNATINYLKTMTAGSHTFKIQWKVTIDGTATATGILRKMQVIELK